MSGISNHLNSHYFLLICSRFLVNFLDLGNFLSFLSEKLKKKNRIVSNSSVLLQIFFLIFFKKKNDLGKFSFFLAFPSQKCQKFKKKKEKENKIMKILFFFFIKEFFCKTLLVKKKSRGQKDFNPNKLLGVVQKIQRKLLHKKKKIKNFDNENLIYLNKISKFQIRKNNQTSPSFCEDSRFNLLKLENLKKKEIDQFKDIRGNFSLIDISKQRLSKIHLLYSILKSRKTAKVGENFHLIIFRMADSLFYEKELRDYLSNRIKKFRAEKSSFPKIKNFFFKLKKSLKQKILKHQKILSVPKQTGFKKILDMKNILDQWSNVQMNSNHFFCLILNFMVKDEKLEKLERLNTKENLLKRKKVCKFLIENNYLVGKKIKNLENFNQDCLTNFNMKFINKSKKENLIWKVLIFLTKAIIVDFHFKKKQKYKTKKWFFFLEKLKSSRYSRKEMEFMFRTQFKILKQNSINLNLWTSKFFSLQRLFFYQSILIKKIFATEFNSEEPVRKKTKSKTLRSLVKKVQKIKYILKTDTCSNDILVLKDLKRKLNCSVLDNLQKEIILVDCGHSFSSKCIKDLISSRNRTCPLCGKKFSNGNLKPIFFS